LAVARFEEMKRLRRRLADRAVIERAKGRVMATLGLAEDDAFRLLRNRAMDTRSTLGEVARDVIAHHREAS
jgi:response regulator NasT